MDKKKQPHQRRRKKRPASGSRGNKTKGQGQSHQVDLLGKSGPMDIPQKRLAFDSRSQYVGHFRRLVDLERQAELDRHMAEMKRLSGFQREKKGRALMNMRGRRAGRGIGGRSLVKYMKQRVGEPLPNHEFQVGDQVVVSQGSPLKKGNPSGMVIDRSRFAITVVFDRLPAKWATKGGLRVDLSVNDTTYQRMHAALDLVLEGREQSIHLLESLMGLKGVQVNGSGGDRAETIKDLVEGVLVDKNLNTSQKDAVAMGLTASDYHIIHGPPGTGKTVTAVAVVEVGVERGKRVLACADSNGAVDNLVEGLVDKGLKVVRLGHPFRVNETLLSHTLDAKLETHPSQKKIQALRDQAFDRMKDQEGLTHPSPRWTRGMSNGDIRRFARKGKGTRGVSAETLEEMAQWLDIREDIDAFFAKADQLEQDTIQEILRGADVVCATNIGAGMDMLEGWLFDLVVIDEATQSTEASSLVPLVLGRQAVLLGDPMQLPPTVLSDAARQGGMDYSLLERLVHKDKNKWSSLLAIQYRMNEDLLAFPNKAFYDCQLTSGDRNEAWTLATCPLKQSDLFVALQGQEERRGEGQSLVNKTEAGQVVAWVKACLGWGASEGDIGVISPYKAQAAHIRDRLRKAEIFVECDTVDGFQGREKDIVLISLVRSNGQGQLGFLNDLRRLNVALTRAKKLRVVIGDDKTLKTHSVYGAYLASAHWVEPLSQE